MAWRLAWGFGLFVGSLALGFSLGRRGHVTEARAAALIRLAVDRLAPIVLCLSFWSLSLSGLGQWLLPLIGFATSCAALAPAWGYARAAHLSRPQTGSFLTCAMFSNLGYLGAFIAFALRGEAAYGLAMLYLVFFSPAFYLIGFTIARRFGVGATSASTAAFSADEIRLLPFLGLLVGLALSLARVPRPPVCEPINQWLIPLDTALYLVAIGSQLSLERPSSRWLGPCLAMSTIKFLYSPAIGWALASLARLEGLARFVVLVQSAMPVAISPLMLPLLFGLDRRLSSILWISTTVAAVPWLWLYLEYLPP